MTKAGGYSIRIIGESDWERLRDIRLRMLEQAPEAFAVAGAEGLFEESDWRAWGRESAEGVNGRKWVAVAGDTWIGTAFCDVDPSDSEAGRVYGIWVEPGWRGQGVAAALLDALEDWAKEKGLKRLFLRVNVENVVARRLYGRLAFEDTGVREPMRGRPEHMMMTMEKNLK